MNFITFILARSRARFLAVERILIEFRALSLEYRRRVQFCNHRVITLAYIRRPRAFRASPISPL